MSMDVYNLFQSLSAEDFRNVSRTHHVNSWREDASINDTAIKDNCEWIEKLKPPPIKFTQNMNTPVLPQQQPQDDLAYNVEDHLKEDQQLQPPMKSYRDVLKVSRVKEIQTTGGLTEAFPTTVYQHSTGTPEVQDEQLINVRSAKKSSSSSPFNHNENSWVAINNVNRVNLTNKMKSLHCYSSLSESDLTINANGVKNNENATDAIQIIKSVPDSIREGKSTIAKFKNSLKQKKKLSSSYKDCDSGVNNESNALEVKHEFIKNSKSNSHDEKILTEDFSMKPVESCLPENEQKETEQSIYKIFAYNKLINESFYCQYLHSLFVMFQNFVPNFSAIQEQINEKCFYFSILCYFVYHFNLWQLMIWAIIIYNLIKMSYGIVTSPTSETIKYKNWRKSIKAINRRDVNRRQQ